MCFYVALVAQQSDRVNTILLSIVYDNPDYTKSGFMWQHYRLFSITI